MNFPFYIARRYLIAKKSHNVINIISAISVFGVATGTMALVIVLSVFNGFESLIKSLFSAVDPDLKISLVEGKVFTPTEEMIEKLGNTPGVVLFSEVLEENALFTYGERQHIGTLKGVDENYESMTGLDTMLYEGKFDLFSPGHPSAVVGQGVANTLAIGLHFVNPLNIFIPRRTGRVSLNPEQAFNRQYVFPAGIVMVEPEFDQRFVIVPIEMSRRLLEYDREVTALDLKLEERQNVNHIKKDLQQFFGESFRVQDRFEQQEWLYRVMKSEKWAIFFILSFILLVASFNIIGSLTMLIIEKKKDVAVLRSLGADNQLIRKIFLFEGWMISFIGALMGLLLGAAICFLQQEFGLVRLSGDGLFIIDAYPVEMQAADFLWVFSTVLFIGFLAAWYPVRYISGRFIQSNE
jgi:lipoprotein-releasing system permease protein